jgi:hypothetical protein
MVFLDLYEQFVFHIVLTFNREEAGLSATSALPHGLETAEQFQCCLASSFIANYVAVTSLFNTALHAVYTVRQVTLHVHNTGVIEVSAVA